MNYRLRKCAPWGSSGSCPRFQTEKAVFRPKAQAAGKGFNGISSMCCRNRPGSKVLMGVKPARDGISSV